ncbi:MAG: DUF1828 domain-containing protein [Methylotenera sp.]|nr:DUF1828 domain-containing protein [Methylotenera sp.]
MLEMLDEKMLCAQFCAQIKLHRRENGLVFLETPFKYPDGDQYPLYLTETSTGGLRISDGGHTLMHLSYENDVDKFFEGSRSILFNQIIAEQDVNYAEDSGQFYLECAPANLSEAAFRLGQAITRIYDLTFLNRSRVASTFYEDLQEQIGAFISIEKIHKNFVVAGVPNADHYPVDFCIDGKDNHPLFLFGIPNRDKARLTTIFLQYFIQQKVDFDSMLVFENQEDIPRSDLARLSNVGGDMISSLNAEDDFRRKLLRKVA